MSKTRLQPVVWTPPKRTYRAKAKQSTPPMPRPRLIPLDGFTEPEDVVVDASGRLITGVAGGRILRVTPEDGAVEVIGDTGGRPLGLEVLPSGALLVCDEKKGLLHLDPADGSVTTLVDHVNGTRLTFCSNASVAPDGTVYFSQSSDRFGLDHYMGDMYEHGSRGRLFRLTPGGTVEVLLTGLDFTNGVSVSHGGDAVTFVETGAYRVRRLWVGGPRAGTVDVVVENLPGFPDNCGRDPVDGTLWVAIAAPRDPRLDLLHRLPGFVRKIAWAIPEKLQPPLKTCFVLGIDDSGDGAGHIVRDLQRRGDVYDFATGVARRGDKLYLAGLHVNALAEVPLS